MNHDSAPYIVAGFAAALGVAMLLAMIFGTG